MTPAAIEFSEAAIFGRLLEANAYSLSPESAGYILSLRLSAADEQRIDELLPKAQGGILTPFERQQLDNLNHVADVLSLWKSKARRALKQQPSH